MMLKPDFLVIGAAKSGTTSLCMALDQHPEVFITDPKEPHFFSAQYDRGWDWYSSLFAPSGDAAARGEGSVSYTMERHQPDVSRRIAQDLPKARLIYIVRHPLRRIESGWRHLLTMNRTTEDLPGAVAEFPGLVNQSLYWRQINFYRDHFPDERILILFFEDFISETESELEKCWRFLGVDDSFVPPDQEASNVSRGQWRWPVGVLLRGMSLPGWMQPPDRAKRWLRKVLLSPFGSEEKQPSWPPSLKADVLARVRPDARKLLEHCGKPPDFWDLAGPA